MVDPSFPRIHELPRVAQIGKIVAPSMMTRDASCAPASINPPPRRMA